MFIVSEGILNTISNVLPQASTIVGGASGNSSQSDPINSVPPMQGSSQGNFTVPPVSTFSHHVGPIEFGPGGQITQTQHIHLGTVPVAMHAPGEIPPEGIQLDGPLGGIPFAIPPGAIPFVPPGNVRFGAPQVNIQFGPPPAIHRPGPPQSSNIQQGPLRPQSRPSPPRAGNVRGPPQTRHIRMVGFHMEEVPLSVPGGAMGMGMGMGNGPIITPAQQQLYQQHTAQQQMEAGGQNEGEQWNNSQEPPAHPDDDMELD